MDRLRRQLETETISVEKLTASDTAPTEKPIMRRYAPWTVALGEGGGLVGNWLSHKDLSHDEISDVSK